MRAVKQCVIGQPTMKTPIIYWVQLQALIHSQPLYVNSKMIGEETKRQILEKKAFTGCCHRGSRWWLECDWYVYGLY